MSGCEFCNIQIPHYRAALDGMKLKDVDGEYTHKVVFGIIGQHRFYATSEDDYRTLINEQNQIIQFCKLNYCPNCGRKISKGGD